MAMNLILLRALNSSRAHARPMLALAFRGPIHAAVPRLSGNPIMCSSRLFSGFTPAPSPTTNPKPTTKVDTIYQQPTNEMQGPVKKWPTKYSAASPEHMSAGPDHERGQKPKLMSPEKHEEAKLEELRAKLIALPESPKQYDELVQAVGSTSLLQINRERALSGKKKLHIPASLRRPVRKSSGFRSFLEAKVASGDVSTLDGLPAARRRARELWRELTPSQKAAYYTQWETDYEQRRAARSQA
ncbi:hypothetical protein BKA62DRAFT_771206 [Auriculariales sp. MPI-PUGE-AT-0066]|nr:hypothetical protein BKA62DRAFT_771206 [Auriculariales sp. MPI-PUGE-AT-0066]